MAETITSIDDAPIKNPILQTTDNSGNTFTLSLPKKAGTVAVTSDITTATSSLATQTALNSVSSDLDALEERVDGMQPAQVFDTLADMQTWLANSANTTNLPIGTNLFIRALDVPDYWWDGTTAQQLETAKANLTNVVTQTGTETLTNKTITDPILKDSSTDYSLTVPTLTENTTIATRAWVEDQNYLTQHQSLSDYVTKTGTESLSNKTLSNTTITGNTTRLVNNQLIANNGVDTIRFPSSARANIIHLVGDNDTQTLYNKTLSAPILKNASSSSTYTLTMPTLTESTTIATTKDLTNYAASNHTHTQYATKTGTETLSNKTIDGATTELTGMISYYTGSGFDIRDCGFRRQISDNFWLTLRLPEIDRDTVLATTGDLADAINNFSTHELTLYSKTLIDPIIKKDGSSDYTLSVPTLTQNATIATQAWVADQNYLTQHQSLTDYVTKTGTETLSNKTITAPTIKDSSTDYTLTVPTLAQDDQIATTAMLSFFASSWNNQLNDKIPINGQCIDITGYKRFKGATFLYDPTFTLGENDLGGYRIPQERQAEAYQYLVATDTTQTLTNKTLTSPTITAPTLKDSSTSFALTVPTLTQNTTIATAKDLTGYATTSHNHNSAYASISHNHNSAYASLSHNHDGVYTAASHTHNNYATKTGTEELTNKTLTTPIIKNPTLKDNNTSFALTVPRLSADTTIATAKDLTNYAAANHTHSQYLTQHQSLADYATLTGSESLYNKTIRNSIIDNPILKDPAYSSYSLTVDYLIEDATIATSTHLKNYAPLTHFHSQYLTQHQSLADYVTKTGNETLTNKTITNPTLKDSGSSYALTVPYLREDTTIATAKDLTGYATLDHTHSQYLTQHQSLTNYVTLTGTQELTNKTLTTPIIKNPKLRDSSHTYDLTVPTLSADAIIATQAWVNDKGYLTQHQSLTNYVTKTGQEELTNKTITNPILKCARLRDGSTDYNLTVPSLTSNAVIATCTWVLDKGYLTKHQSLTDYVTKTGTEELTNKTIKNPKLRDSSHTYDLTVPSLSANAVIATQEWVTGKNYLTGHQSLDDCVKTTGDQTVAGVKTFSSAPIFSTNSIKNSSNKVITLPSAKATLATTNDLSSKLHLLSAAPTI